MIAWLRKLLTGPARQSHPTFGDMLYLGGYWEAQGVFPPTGEAVEYFVEADEAGPTPENLAAHCQICERFSDLSAKAYRAVSRAVAEAGMEAPPPASLKVSSLDIPAGPLMEADWELGLSSEHGTVYVVQFRGLEPSGPVDISS